MNRRVVGLRRERTAREGVKYDVLAEIHPDDELEEMEGVLGVMAKG